MDSIESVESVISSHSITNYHSEGSPIFNQKSSTKLDLGPTETSLPPLSASVFKILAQIPHGTSRFIKS